MNFYNLQMFAEEGTAEADAGVQAQESVVSSDDYTQTLLQRQKKKENPLANVIYGKQDAPAEESPPTQEEKKVGYDIDEMMKDEAFKKAFQERFEKSLGERMKKSRTDNESLKGELSRYKGITDVLSSKYGLDSSSKTYLDDLKKAVDADDDIYSKYADEHDMSVESARRMMNLERRVQEQEAISRKAQAEQENRARWDEISRQAEETKKLIPNFDLQRELQDERYLRMIANGLNTTDAFFALHHADVIPQAVGKAEQKAKEQAAATVEANRSRPVENGIISQSVPIVKTDPKNLTKEDRAEIRRRVFRGDKIRF